VLLIRGPAGTSAQKSRQQIAKPRRLSLVSQRHGSWVEGWLSLLVREVTTSSLAIISMQPPAGLPDAGFDGYGVGCVMSATGWGAAGGFGVLFVSRD
jgi:hypothetical protein